jgi:hypothetical protein
MNHIRIARNRLVNNRILISVVIFSGFLFFSDTFGQIVLKDSVINGNNFEKAAFSLWFKSGIKKIRGLIVLVSGSNIDGRSMVYDTAWQNLAVRLTNLLKLHLGFPTGKSLKNGKIL